MARILIVDDEADVREVIRGTLAGVGHQVAEASSGKEVLSLLGAAGRRRARTPALILLDLVLPDFDGFSVILRLRVDSRYRDVPILLLTGRGDLVSVFGGSPAVHGQIEKPFLPAELLRKVDAVLGAGATR